MLSPILILSAILFLLWNWVKILNEYELAVIYQLGRVQKKPRGPGIVIVMWPFERAVIISTRIVTLDVPPQDIITKDNVSCKVNAVCYFRVVDPIRADVEIQDYQYATSQMAQTTLRSILGEMEFDDLLTERDKINQRIQVILDKNTDPWGIKITSVEVKDVDISEELRRAMARQAEAERERRAKVIAAEGELQAAEKITQAAERMAQSPGSMQLRYLQTLVEISNESNTVTLFPIPIDIMEAFRKNLSK